MIANTQHMPSASDIAYGMTEMSDPELAAIDGGAFIPISPSIVLLYLVDQVYNYLFC